MRSEKGAAAREEGREQREKREEGREQRGMREERREEREERREKSAERSEKREEITKKAARDPQMRPREVPNEVPRGLWAGGMAPKRVGP